MKIYLLPLFVALVIEIIVDFFIYHRIKHQSKGIWQIFNMAHIAISITLGAFVLFLAVAPNSLLSAHTLLFSSAIYYYSSLLATKIGYVAVVSIIHIFHSKKLERYANFLAIIFALWVISEATYATLATRYDIKTEYVTVQFDNLPKGFDGYRIAQFSDLHLGTYGDDTTFVHKVVQTINAEKADVIMFTGDLVNGKSDEAKCFIKSLSQLHAPDGVFSILGNHDYSDYTKWSSADAKKRDRTKLVVYQKSAGWNLLLNTNKTIHHGNDSIVIIGVENIGKPPFHTYGNLKKAYGNLRDDNFKILLSHTPTHWSGEVVSESNINLTLSGHTHAMQMMFQLFGKKFSPASLVYKEWSGLYSNPNGQKLYVNTGLGCIGMPARFGAKPEITVITLKRKE